MIRTPNHVHSPCREARQNTDQQLVILRYINSAGQGSGPTETKVIEADSSISSSLSTMNQGVECNLHILLPHQGFPHQNGVGSSGLNPIEISAVKES